MSKTRKRILQITLTAVMIALLVVAQWGLGALTGGNQFVVGSAVNLILILTSLFIGLVPAIAVACISPFLAFAFGIGTPEIVIVPFIAVGNLVLVLCWYFISARKQMWGNMIISLVVGAALKYAALFLLVTKLAVPVILALPEPKASVISAAFSWPQLVTALIGGVIAIIIAPIVTPALRSRKYSSENNSK